MAKWGQRPREEADCTHTHLVLVLVLVLIEINDKANQVVRGQMRDCCRLHARRLAMEWREICASHLVSVVAMRRKMGEGARIEEKKRDETRGDEKRGKYDESAEQKAQQLTPK